MYLMYADESGSTGTDYDNKQQPIFVLGSLLVKDSDWHNINYLFDKGKTEICEYFEQNEIHANEIFNSKKNTYFGNKDWHDNFKILEDLVSLISTFDITFQYVMIDKKSFKKMLNEKYGNHVKLDPYLYSFVKLYEETSEYIENINETGLIFLDQLIKIDKSIAMIYPSIQNKYLDHIVEHPFFLDSSDSNFIQIVDLYSFYINKYYCLKNGYQNYIDLKNNHCIKMYKKLEKQTRAHIVYL